jgi:AP-1 complex subunit gamma-1
MLLEACPDLGTGPVSEAEVIAWYNSIMWAHHITVVTKQYALVSLTKLSTRFPNSTAAIQQAVDTFGSNVDVDLQQRGVEFGQLFRGQAAIRPQVLEPMPPIERSRSLEVAGPVLPTAAAASTNLLAGPEPGGLAEPPPPAESSALMDLLGLGDPMPGPAVLPKSPGGLEDILGLGAPSLGPSLLDGLGGLDLSGPAAVPVTNGGLDNLLNGVDPAAFVAPSSEAPSLVAYDKHGLRVVFTFPSGAATAVTLLAHNLAGSPITEFVFQVHTAGTG